MYDAPQRTLKQSVDWKLVVCYLLLVLIGWINIYAASHAAEVASMLDFSVRSGKQFVWILTSLGLAALILFVFNPRLWEVISVPTYLFVLVLLVAVIVLGVEVKGSRSWFALGPVRFQPAEVSKIATSLLLATVMSRPGFKLTQPRGLLQVAAVIGLPMLVILAESETGSALVYLGFVFVLYREGLSGWVLVAIGAAVLLFVLTLTASPYASALVLIGMVGLFYYAHAGRLKYWPWIEGAALVFLAFLPKLLALFTDFAPLTALAAISGVMLLYLAWKAMRRRDRVLWVAIAAFLVGVALIYSTSFIFNSVLQDHQRKRIEVLLGLKEDPAGVGYNVNQSMIAIGSGGLFGKGFLQGTQTAYGFVPEQSTDFIFCTVGEEWGFAGCLAVILLYIFMISRIIIDAERCRENYTRIYGYCVASLIFMHLLINIGMTIGLVPVIGIPLPFLSYGGSSLWAFTILLFIFLALYRQERKYF